MAYIKGARGPFLPREDTGYHISPTEVIKKRRVRPSRDSRTHAFLFRVLTGEKNVKDREAEWRSRRGTNFFFYLPTVMKRNVRNNENYIRSCGSLEMFVVGKSV